MSVLWIMDNVYTPIFLGWATGVFILITWRLFQ